MGAKSAEITGDHCRSDVALLMVHMLARPGHARHLTLRLKSSTRLTRRNERLEATRFLFAKEDGEWLKQICERGKLRKDSRYFP